MNGDMGRSGVSKVIPYPVATECPYCGGHVELIGNDFIYGRKYGNGMCYACIDCKANVGVHDGTVVPLGRLANRATTNLRKQCHSLFDPLWRGKKAKMSRMKAYGWLADQLGIPFKECHMAWLTDDQLRKTITLLEAGVDVGKK